MLGMFASKFMQADDVKTGAPGTKEVAEFLTRLTPEQKMFFFQEIMKSQQNKTDEQAK